jgi:ferredoxin
MKAFVDPDTCMGCGVCETISPKVFQLGSETYAVVIADVVPPDEEANVREAMDACPEGSITIQE